MTIVFCSCIAQLAVAVLKEFREMLHKQATVEAFIEWLDVSVEQKIIKVCITTKPSTVNCSEVD